MGEFLVVLYFIIKFAPSLRISLTELLKQIAGYSYTWVRGSSVTRSFEALEILTEKNGGNNLRGSLVNLQAP